MMDYDLSIKDLETALVFYWAPVEPTEDIQESFKALIQNIREDTRREAVQSVVYGLRIANHPEAADLVWGVMGDNK